MGTAIAVLIHFFLLMYAPPPLLSNHHLPNLHPAATNASNCLCLELEAKKDAVAIVNIKRRAEIIDAWNIAGICKQHRRTVRVKPIVWNSGI